jgi:hypothetical protein
LKFLQIKKKEIKSRYKVEVKISTGIYSLTDDADVQIYPNPSKGKFQIDFRNVPKHGTWIQIYNSEGKLIRKFMAKNNVEYLNLEWNPTGLYFVRINHETSKTYKLILE